MGVTTSTLAGHRVTSGRANIPAWGCWYADVSIDGEVELTGSVDFVIADLTLKGTVLSGGPAKGRSDFRIVAGAGGWGRTIPSKSYANDATVKVSTVLADAATSVGETLTTTSAARTGPAFVRKGGPASRVLELLAPHAWYVDEAGVTRLGRRPTTPFVGKATRVKTLDKARAVVVLAAESVATLLPGATVDGIEALDVLHEVDAKKGLRTTLWGALGSGNSRRLDAMRTIVDQLDPNRAYRGVTEYRVVTQEGKRLNLQPVRVSTGMPDLRRVLAYPGVPGCEADVKLGSRVLVAFVDSDPGRPYVAGFEDAEGEGFIPTTLKIAGGLLGVARMTDPVQAGPFAGTITQGSTKVKVG